MLQAPHVLALLRSIRSSQAGMTLVETLVAIAILGVAAGAFILALSTGMIASRFQDEDAVGQALAQAQMEAVKAAAFDASGVSYPAVTPPAGYNVSLNTTSSLYGSTNIQKVSVAVSHGGAAVFTLEDYKVNR